MNNNRILKEENRVKLTLICSNIKKSKSYKISWKRQRNNSKKANKGKKNVYFLYYFS